MKLRTLSLLAGLAVLGSAQAGPVVLYDNLTPGGYSSADGWVINSAQSLAQMFTPSVGATLTQLQLSLSPTTGPFFEVQLVNSEAATTLFGLDEQPGTTVYASWTNVQGQGLNLFNLSSPVSVVAGMNYWVVVRPTANQTGTAFWYQNANGINGTMAAAFGTTWSLGDDSSDGGGMKVIGETGVPVPEPATVALAGLALGLAARRRRNR